MTPNTFLSCAVRNLTLEEADAGCLVLGVGWVLPGVPQDLGESDFEVLLRSGQTEMPAGATIISIMHCGLCRRRWWLRAERQWLTLCWNTLALWAMWQVNARRVVYTPTASPLSRDSEWCSLRLKCAKKWFFLFNRHTDGVNLHLPNGWMQGFQPSRILCKLSQKRV